MPVWWCCCGIRERGVSDSRACKSAMSDSDPWTVTLFIALLSLAGVFLWNGVECRLFSAAVNRPGSGVVALCECPSSPLGLAVLGMLRLWEKELKSFRPSCPQSS